MAAVDYFLKIEGIQGESADAKHKGEIELVAFSWGESQSGTMAAGGGAAAGKVQMQDLAATMRTNKASPILFLACASGQQIKQATLTVRKAGEQQQEFLIIKLSDLLISQYQTSGGGDEVPMDQISLNFGRLEVEYRPQKADGSLDAPVKGGWDVRANRKI